ncbi:restriction endonuclease subunit S [Mesoflavibacter zeaxanthinifaciens]|uniref:restriction endonuclease subunit S n=1 Tax=Mesoflavibacter zeaxanthinifaciens TaxID=393060 RepID=UPI003A8D8725
MGKWQEVEIGEIVEKTNTENPKSSPDFEFSYIDISSIDREQTKIVEPKLLFGSEAPSRARKKVIPGDILFATTRPNLKNIAIVEDNSTKQIASTGFCVLRGNKTLIENRFLFNFLLTEEVQEQIEPLIRGAQYPAISDRDLKSVKIPLPPLPEQQRIVTKLDGLFAKIDQAIGLLEENIKHTQALMGSVLDEEFGKLDCEWFKLEDVSKIVGGGTPKTAISEYWADEVVWLSPVDLPPIGVISKVSDSGKKISKLGLQKSSAKLLPIGTVVFSSRASIGKIAITECELATNQGFTNFIPNEGVNNIYLAKTLKHYTPNIEALSNSTTFKEVSKTSLKTFKIPLPQIEIQLELSKKFSAYQKVIDSISLIQTQKLNHLKALKSSLLDQAFKGEL